MCCIPRASHYVKRWIKTVKYFDGLLRPTHGLLDIRSGLEGFLQTIHKTTGRNSIVNLKAACYLIGMPHG